MFYPGDPEKLRREIQGYLKAVQKAPPPPKGIIGPHAGTIYSGPIAATAYASLIPVRNKIKKVVLLGPSHHVPIRGIVAPTTEAWATPLGTTPVDQETLQSLANLPQVQFLNEAHEEEHSLELHQIFLQEVLDDFSLIPLVVSRTQPPEVAEVLNQVWGGDETIIVVSTDLTHYLDYETARRIDEKSSKAIEELRFEDLEDTQACGLYPVRGFLLAARQHKLKGKTVDLRNSGDTCGDKSRVVGYGAYIFS